MLAIDLNNISGSSLKGIKPRRFQKFAGLDIDSIDDECTSANQAGRGYKTLQRMLEQSSTDSFSAVILIGCKLSQQQAGNGIGRLSGPD